MRIATIHFSLLTVLLVGQPSFAQSPKPTTLKGHKHRAFSLAFSPDGKRLLVGRVGGTIAIWNVTTRREMSTIRGFKGVDEFDLTWVNCIVCFPNSHAFVASSAGHLGEIKFWDEKYRLGWTSKAHQAGTRCLALSPDSKTLASGGTFDWDIKIWDSRTGKLLRTLKGTPRPHGVYSVAFSPDGKSLASGGSDGVVRIWDLKSGKSTAMKGHEDTVFSVDFSPDGSLLASSSLTSIRLWDVGMQKQQSLLYRSKYSVYEVRFTPDGNRLISAGADALVRIWEVRKDSLMTPLRTKKSTAPPIALSKDGKILATSTRGPEILLWNIGRKKQ